MNPPSLLADLPPLILDPCDIWPLLPTNLLFKVFLPAVPAVIDQVPHLSPDIRPSWSRELEAWYEIFHAGVWPLLQADDDADSAYLARVEARLAEREGSIDGSKLPPSRKEVRQLEGRREKVEARQYQRWVRLYALQLARDAHLRYFRARMPDATDEFIRDKLDLLGSMRFPPAGTKANSVWPLLKPYSHYRSRLDPASARLAPPTHEFSGLLNLLIWNPGAKFTVADVPANEIRGAEGYLAVMNGEGGGKAKKDIPEGGRNKAGENANTSCAVGAVGAVTPSYREPMRRAAL
ncbi:hypothetical protein JCM8097_004952 [Rhodosporidiobolus ruineniae]